MRGSEQSQVRIQQPLSRHLFLCQSTRQWQAIINARFSAKSRSPHLFTLRKKRHSSSSWAGKSPNFRREIRQSHYRNDPVKYDLTLLSISIVSQISVIIAPLCIQSICKFFTKTRTILQFLHWKLPC